MFRIRNRYKYMDSDETSYFKIRLKTGLKYCQN